MNKYWRAYWEFINALLLAGTLVADDFYFILDKMPNDCDCKVHFRKYLEDNPPQATIEYILDLHNSVNARLWKRIWTKEEYIDKLSMCPKEVKLELDVNWQYVRIEWEKYSVILS